MLPKIYKKKEKIYKFLENPKTLISIIYHFIG